MEPKVIGTRYELGRVLGHGTSGTVYEAVDRDLGRRVALKVVPLPPTGDSNAADAIVQFRRGAGAAGGLSHPNIVAVFDYGEDANQAWIVMELVEGGSLKTRLDRGKRMSIPAIVQLMIQLLDALAYSHAKGVIHRDIKPANIMLTPGGMVKITDFGIARIENSALTHVGTMMGTPAYMAPEQLRGETVDLRADLWAAGVVLYQLLTGEKPFGGGITSIMQKALYTEPPPPSRLSAASPALDAVVAKALAKRPEDRFASAKVFLWEIVDAAFLTSDMAPRSPASGRMNPAAEPEGMVEPAASEPPHIQASPSEAIPRPGPLARVVNQHARVAGALVPRHGAILWNPPERMKVSRRERVEVRLSEASVVLERLSEGLRGCGVPRVEELTIAALMRVKLTSDPADFAIQPLSTEDQFLPLGVVARWDFDVTPLRSGRRRLRVLASMRVKVAGRDEVVDLPSYECEVRVVVAPVRTAGRFVGKNWQWIAGTVAIPLIVWAAKGTGAGKKVLEQLRDWLGVG